jgi:hypothetical protein
MGYQLYGLIGEKLPYHLTALSKYPTVLALKPENVIHQKCVLETQRKSVHVKN